MIWKWTYGVVKIWRFHFAFGNVAVIWKLFPAPVLAMFSARNIHIVWVFDFFLYFLISGFILIICKMFYTQTLYTVSPVALEIYLQRIRNEQQKSGWTSIKVNFSECNIFNESFLRILFCICTICSTRQSG